ncbi:hypothetical protein [Microbispora sp. KK1-11]|uniref:hypothetical protein n=1 Tax=Microbispora sp. KK1-11 TaxID=2053005 RepID=UPI0011594F92|nr:hypothetical protein [Microbispora sp. KK1-11]TQS30053.1 hypothetical protein FLW16_06745 [Microbispora sp. KK1-11]
MRVRTTIEPGKVLDVSEAEYLDLKRQGLLLPNPNDEQVRIAQGAADQPAPRAPKQKPATDTNKES